MKNNHSSIYRRVVLDSLWALALIPFAQLIIFKDIFIKELLVCLGLMFAYNFSSWMIRLKSLGNAMDEFFKKFFIFNGFKFFLLLLFILFSFKYSILVPVIFVYTLLMHLIIISMSDVFKLKGLI